MLGIDGRVEMVVVVDVVVMVLVMVLFTNRPKVSRLLLRGPCLKSSREPNG